MNKIEHKEWAEQVPFLAAMTVRNPFIVPDGYFDKLDQENTTQLVVHSFAGNNHTQAGFTVPENYFADLTGHIISRVNTAAYRSQDAGFSLPAGYFENLTSRILEKTAEPKKEAKIIRLWHSDLMKYASAACVILVTAATLFFNQQQYKIDQTSTAELYSNEQMLYDIDEATIIEHIQSNKEASSVANMPNAQLEDYIIDHYSSNDIQGL